MDVVSPVFQRLEARVLWKYPAVLSTPHNQSILSPGAMLLHFKLVDQITLKLVRKSIMKNRQARLSQGHTIVFIIKLFIMFTMYIMFIIFTMFIMFIIFIMFIKFIMFKMLIIFIMFIKVLLLIRFIMIILFIFFILFILFIMFMM